MRADTAGFCMGSWILLTAWAAAAEPPLSAIDWLSDSVADPGEVTLPRGSLAPGPITVAPIDAPEADAAGLLPPSVTGFPKDLWGPSTAQDAMARLEAVPRDLSPALSQLLTTLLLAEAKAPRGSQDGEALFLTRVDRLLDMGALDRAGALLERAGVTTPERFRRHFDIALLEGREQAACDTLRLHPEIAPTYAARIFCLARNGDWNAAALTLETATSLGILSPEEDLLLARFLDPEILPDDSLPPVPETPLTFRMREAIGEPVPSTTLPLAFAWADFRPTRGWKAQLQAAERLARAGALNPNQFFGLYLRRAPSASGGVWERVADVQALDTALSVGDRAAVARALPEAWETLRAAGLQHALADQYGEELARLKFDGKAGEIALALGLLSPAYETVANSTNEGDAFVLALARGIPETALATSPAAVVVRDGFLAEAPPTAIALMLAQGRVGEAILRAITQFSEGAEGELDGVSDAIATLRALGLETAARRASLELLLRDGIG